VRDNRDDRESRRERDPHRESGFRSDSMRMGGRDGPIERYGQFAPPPSLTHRR
jgi:hypothetical protein